MVNAYFEKKLQEIREDDMQLAAYKAVNNTVVIAGPGSGKTTVLTLKVMQLLAEVIYPPRGLACLTYSTEAVREFKSRLVKLGLEKRKNVFLGTVHSFCLSQPYIRNTKYPCLSGLFLKLKRIVSLILRITRELQSSLM